MIASIIRKIFLVFLIVFDVLMLLCWWMAAQYVFFWVFVGITLIVIIGEIVSVILTKKTLSTNVTKTLEQIKEKRVWIYGALACLGIAIGSLIVHLAVW